MLERENLIQQGVNQAGLLGSLMRSFINCIMLHCGGQNFSQSIRSCPRTDHFAPANNLRNREVIFLLCLYIDAAEVKEITRIVDSLMI